MIRVRRRNRRGGVVGIGVARGERVEVGGGGDIEKEVGRGGRLGRGGGGVVEGGGEVEG